MLRSFVRLSLAATLLAVTSASLAATYRVGRGGGCHFAQIQDAVDAAARNPGLDVIRISQGAANAGQAIMIRNQAVTLIGGFTSCNDFRDDPGLDQTVVSGEGGASASVITIQGTSDVALLNLVIYKGDSGSLGGGVRYDAGPGGATVNRLLLGEVHFLENRARHGAGLYFHGGDGARLELVEGVAFFDNVALENGGGIHLAGAAQLDAAAHRLFFHRNKANEGGGLYVAAPAQADIGSAAWDGNPTFVLNQAVDRGGAISVRAAGSGSSAAVRLYSIRADLPMMLTQNSSASGGVFHVVGDPGALNARLCLRLVRVNGNGQERSPIAAVFDGRFGHCSGEAFPGARPTQCAPGARCNLWNGNVASSTNPARGALIESYGTSIIDLVDLDLRQNTFSTAFVSAFNQGAIPGAVAVRNSVLAANTANRGGATMFRLRGNVGASITMSTVAANAVATGDASVFDASLSAPFAPRMSIDRSIVALQDDMVLRRRDAGFDPSVMTLDSVLFAASVPDEALNPTVRIGDPRFVGPQDFHLSPDSPAIDFAVDLGDLNYDLDGVRRGVDDVDVDDFLGPVDVGAFEAQPGFRFKSGFEAGETPPPSS